MDSKQVVFLVLAGFALAFLTLVLILRHRRDVLRHQERLQVIERGGVLPSLDEERPKAPWTPRAYLLRGMLWLYTGIAITIMLGAISVSVSRPPSMSSKVWQVKNLRDNGATEQQIQQYVREADNDREGLPLGAATIGLIRSAWASRTWCSTARNSRRPRQRATPAESEAGGVRGCRSRRHWRGRRRHCLEGDGPVERGQPAVISHGEAKQIRIRNELMSGDRRRPEQSLVEQ